MGFYTGFDLHSNNSYVGIINEDGGRLWIKRLRNDPSMISEMLKPFKKDIEGIVVESTYNPLNGCPKWVSTQNKL